LTGNVTLTEQIKSNPMLGKMAISLLLTEFTEPFRIGFVLLATPTIAGYFGKK
jgi:hypothetical protein